MAADERFGPDAQVPTASRRARVPTLGVKMHSMLLAVLLLNSGCSAESEPDAAAEGEAEAMTSELSVPTLVARHGETAAAIAREIELKPTKDYADFMDLGTAHLWDGLYVEATEEYEIAAQQARSLEELAAALYAKAGAAGYAGHMPIALQTADQLVRLQPDSVEAAWLRMGLYRHSGDALGMELARDHVLRVDPSAGGHEVFAVTGTMVVVGGVVAVFATAAASGVAIVALTPPDDRSEVAISVFSGITEMGVAGITAIPRAASLGRTLLSAQ